MSIDEPVLAVNEIQGNILRGFRTRYLHLAGYKIIEPIASKPWITALADRLTTLAQVHQFRLSRSKGEASVSSTVLLNAALSHRGIEVLGVNVTGISEGFFRQPMGKLALSLGDRVIDNEPIDYAIGKTWDDTPDILFILGSDEVQSLTQTHKDLRVEAEEVGLQHIYSEDGAELPGGIEHFGYRDGISQPGARGRLSDAPDDFLTLRQIDPTDPHAEQLAKPGQPLVWTGQFVFGYPTQFPSSSLTPGPISNGGELWMKNGSFLVFRRLRQDVRAFRNFLTEKSQELSTATGRTYTPRQLGAAIVGRWEDGTPVTISPEKNAPDISKDDFWVNHFAFRHGTNEIKVIDRTDTMRLIPGSQEDDTGQRCPFFAHIRKVNPRDIFTDRGNAGVTLTFQMLRRGIPYGPIFEEGQNEQADRGLLFLAYQTSITNQFQSLNKGWMNNPSAPDRIVNAGHDMVVGQNPSGSRFCSFRDAAHTEIAKLETLARWVIPTGGAFLFSPSISFFRSL